MPELSIGTQIKFLTENSAPSPAGGIVFLLFLSIDPAGLPAISKTSDRLLKKRLTRNALRLGLADNERHTARVRTSHCFRYIGYPDTLFYVEAMLNINAADHHTAFYDPVNGLTKLVLEEAVAPMDVTWLYAGSDHTHKVKFMPY